MFNTKEQQIIKWGLENGKSKQEVREALINFRGGLKVEKPEENKPGFFEEAGTDIKEIGSDIKESVLSGAEKTQEALDAGVRGDQGAFRTTAQVIGQGAMTTSNIIGNVIKGVVKTFLPQKTEEAVGQKIEDIATPIIESKPVQDIMERYNSLDDKTKRDVEAILGIVSLTADVAAGGAAKKGFEVVGKKGIETTAKVAQKAGEIASDVSKQAKNIIGGTKDIAEVTARNMARVPGRISANIAENKAVIQSVKKLPTKVAQNAAENGVDINDLKFLYAIPDGEKEAMRKLFKVSRAFEKGTTKTNPIEIIGKPITNRLNQLEATRVKVGNELGQIANKLGKVSREELAPEILNQLKRVPGLEGLKVSKKGLLDFKDTVLATAETTSDRNVIQKIFTDAIKSGTGRQKHLLRQELFEALGGKRKARLALTGTQENAYEAIRRGVSNVLDTKNASYKALNNRYRKIAQPLAEMRKFMKNVAGAEEDILDMSAGLLARRLTSNAASNPEIRRILQAMDEATKITGKTRLSVENLQDFYNILDKYYNISGKTSLQTQVKLGIEKARGIGDIVAQTFDKIAGKTDAVTKKAIEDAISEALGL